MIALWGFRLNPAGQSFWVWTLLCSYLAWTLTFLFEPLLLHLWGTTPGKWVFGLSVRDEDGQKLTLRTALARTLGVFVHGMGGGIPFYDLYRSYTVLPVLRRWKSCRGIWITACAIVVRERESRMVPRAAGYHRADRARSSARIKGIALRAELPPHQGELTLAEYVDNCNDYLEYR